MDNIPNDIVQCFGALQFQSQHDYYMKKRTDTTHTEFYFRISCSRSYNSTVVFLSDSAGRSVDITEVSKEQYAILKSRYSGTYKMADGRIVLYSGDHTEEDIALWAMSDHCRIYTNCVGFNYDVPELLYKFWKSIETFSTLEQCKEAFNTAFQPGLSYYEQYYANSSPAQDLSTEESKEEDKEDLDAMIKCMVMLSKKYAKLDTEDTEDTTKDVPSTSTDTPTEQ